MITIVYSVVISILFAHRDVSLRKERELLALYVRKNWHKALVKELERHRKIKGQWQLALLGVIPMHLVLIDGFFAPLVFWAIWLTFYKTIYNSFFNKPLLRIERSSTSYRLLSKIFKHPSFVLLFLKLLLLIAAVLLMFAGQETNYLLYK